MHSRRLCKIEGNKNLSRQVRRGLLHALRYKDDQDQKDQNRPPARYVGIRRPKAPVLLDHRQGRFMRLQEPPHIPPFQNDWPAR